MIARGDAGVIKMQPGKLKFVRTITPAHIRFYDVVGVCIEHQADSDIIKVWGWVELDPSKTEWALARRQTPRPW